MESTTRILGALRDLRGVEGSFFASREGVVLSRDLPRIYDGDDLGDVATRMSRFLDALADFGGTNEGVMIRHPNHAIFLRGTEDGFLGVLATADVNVPALKRGASLVVRRLPSAASYASPPPAIDAPRESAPSLPPPLPPPLPTEVRRAVPPPLPIPEARASQPPSPPMPSRRISVPGAPAPRASSPGMPAVRWRGTVKDS